MVGECCPRDTDPDRRIFESRHSGSPLRKESPNKEQDRHQYECSNDCETCDNATAERFLHWHIILWRVAGRDINDALADTLSEPAAIESQALSAEQRLQCFLNEEAGLLFGFWVFSALNFQSF